MTSQAWGKHRRMYCGASGSQAPVTSVEEKITVFVHRASSYGSETPGMERKWKNTASHSGIDIENAIEGAGSLARCLWQRRKPGDGSCTPGAPEGSGHFG